MGFQPLYPPGAGLKPAGGPSRGSCPPRDPFSPSIAKKASSTRRRRPRRNHENSKRPDDGSHDSSAQKGYPFRLSALHSLQMLRFLRWCHLGPWKAQRLQTCSGIARDLDIPASTVRSRISRLGERWIVRYPHNGSELDQILARVKAEFQLPSMLAAVRLLSFLAP